MWFINIISKNSNLSIKWFKKSSIFFFIKIQICFVDFFAHYVTHVILISFTNQILFRNENMFVVFDWKSCEIIEHIVQTCEFFFSRFNRFRWKKIQLKILTFVEMQYTYFFDFNCRNCDTIMSIKCQTFFVWTNVQNCFMIWAFSKSIKAFCLIKIINSSIMRWHWVAFSNIKNLL